MPRTRQQRKGLDHRLLLIPALAIGVGAMISVTLLHQMFLLAECPSRAFIAGMGRSDQNGEMIAFVAGAMVASGLIWAALVRRWGILERSRSNKDAGRLWFKLKLETSKQKLIFLGGPLALIAAFYFGPIFLLSAKFCLADEGVFVRSSVSDDFQRHPWNSIVRIDTDCQRGPRGSWNTAFVATMRDGAGFDLMTAGRQAPGAYPKIADKLRNVNFVFAYHGIEDCGAPLRDIVLRRPR